MSSNTFHVGEVFEGKDWAVLANYPPEGSVLRVKTDRATTSGGSVVFSVGCRSFNLGGMLAQPDRKMMVVNNGGSTITVSANFETDGRGGIKISTTTIPMIDVAEYATRIEVMSLAKVDLRVPTGIYGCDAEGHSHIWALTANASGEADWTMIGSEAKGSAAATYDSGPTTQCKPRLRSSFHAMAGKQKSDTITIPTTVESKWANMISMRDAARKGAAYHAFVTGR